MQVALRMKARGASARAGDVIPYIFCVDEGGETSGKAAQADRAKHPDEIRRATDIKIGERAIPLASVLCVTDAPL